MSNLNSGYIKRDHALKELQQILESKSKIPVGTTDEKGYALGKALGYTDALRDVIGLIKDMPAEEQKPKAKRMIYGDPRSALE